MEILTWCDPRYFVFANALIRSIRFHENENLIHVNLLDFNEAEFETVRELFKTDSKINFIRTNRSDYSHLYDVTDKVEFYRNHRPRLFLKLLENSKDGKLCTFGANGIVFANLQYIEDLLEENEFVFLEREKNNVHTDYPKKVLGINDVQDLVERGISIDDILDTTTGKVVLLGTHAMKKNNLVKDILKNWISLIEETSVINKTYSDMNLFVKSCIEYQMKNNIKIKKETGILVPRKENPFCDTHLIAGNKIWFAKGPLKFNSAKYLDTVKRFSSFQYNL